MTRRYRKQPIAEAICELRFDSGLSWDSATPGLLWAPLQDAYPERREDLLMEARIDTDGGEVRQLVTPMQVLRAASLSGDAILSVSARRLGISRLKPYPGWAEFRNDIQRVLSVADVAFGEVAVVRAGLRYLNRIHLPERDDEVHLEEYLTFYPETPTTEQGLPSGAFSQFLLQVLFACEDGMSALRLQLSPAGPDDKDAQPGRVPFMLDIDHFCDQRGQLTTKTVLAWLEEAHNRVGKAFEACLNDASRELLELVNE